MAEIGFAAEREDAAGYLPAAWRVERRHPLRRRRSVGGAGTRNPQLLDQFRPPASGRPRRAASRAGARRRGGGAGRSAYRAASSRHREADRAQDLSAGDALFRPARLRRADEPGACLLPRDREARRHHGSAARPAHSRPVLRDRPHPVASAQRHHAGDGCRRADASALGLRGAREADDLLRARVRVADARELLPARRRASGSARAAHQRYRGLVRYLPEGPRRSRHAFRRQPHLQAAQRRYRRRTAGGMLEMGLLGRDGAGFRRRLGPAPRAALRVLRGNGLRHSGRQELRQLRPPGHPDGRDAAIGSHHEAVLREAALRRMHRGRSRRRTARSWRRSGAR